MINNQAWGLISVVLCGIGFISAYFIGTYFYTSLIHSASYKKLKDSAEALKSGRTEYETSISISYAKDYTTRLSRYNQYCYSRLLVKKEGLLFKPYYAKNFGLQFKDITNFFIENIDNTLGYRQFVTINSVGSVNDKITIRTDKDSRLIDEISRHYDGEIIGYDI